MKTSLLTTLLLLFSSFSSTAFANDDTTKKARLLVLNAENLCYEKDLCLENFSKVEGFLKEAEKLKPDYAEIYRVWGNLYEYKKEFWDAEEKYKRWAELESDSFRPLERLGTTAYNQGNYSKSNEYYARALELNPTKFYLMGYRCSNFVLTKEWQNAVKECSEALKLNPKYKFALEQRAEAYKALGETKKAEGDLKAASSDRANSSSGIKPR